MTVSELIEKLKELPQDYEVKVKREWFSVCDYDYGMNEYIYDDINNYSICKWDDSKSVTFCIFG